jgi:hypothetical protein
MNKLREQLRSVVGALPHRMLLEGYDLTYHQIVRANVAVSQLRFPLPTLESLDLRAVRQSDTVFILGSGASINEISEARWGAIRAHDSIGFNFGMRHPHIPTMYFIECMDRNREAREIATWARIAYERETDYGAIPKLVTDLRLAGTDMLRLMPPSWRESTFAVDTIPTFARTRSELRTALRKWMRREEFAPSGPIRRLFKYRATLSTLLAAAVRMGYQNIVLCGIDLSSPAYFYHDTRQYPDMRGFWSSPGRTVHASLVAKPMLLPIDEVIEEMVGEVLTPYSVRLFVENASSALYPRVPLVPPELLRSSSQARE